MESSLSTGLRQTKKEMNSWPAFSFLSIIILLSLSKTSQYFFNLPHSIMGKFSTNKRILRIESPPKPLPSPQSSYLWLISRCSSVRTYKRMSCSVHRKTHPGVVLFFLDIDFPQITKFELRSLTFSLSRWRCWPPVVSPNHSQGACSSRTEPRNNFNRWFKKIRVYVVDKSRVVTLPSCLSRASPCCT